MEPAYALLGSVFTIAAASVLAAVQAVGQATNGDLGPWVQGGSAVVAVSALAYIAKLFAQGKLVSRDSAEAEKKLAETNAALVQIVKDGSQREDRLFNLLTSEFNSKK